MAQAEELALLRQGVPAAPCHRPIPAQKHELCTMTLLCGDDCRRSECPTELALEVEGLPPALRSAYPDLLADYVASVIKKGDERPANRQARHSCPSARHPPSWSLHAGLCRSGWQTRCCRH